MRKVLLAIVVVVQLTIVGCHHNTCRNGGGHGCRNCGNSHGSGHGSQMAGPTRVPYLHATQNMVGEGMPGPQTASYSYPYYTLRAPRDFLMNNPPSIGP